LKEAGKNYINMTNKKLLIEVMLSHDIDFAIRCMLMLYQRQTLDEQQAEQSTHQNQRGFNSADAPVLSVYCEAVRNEQPITVFDSADIRARMHKYATQLVPLIADAELDS
jgi:hypothetical protein